MKTNIGVTAIVGGVTAVLFYMWYQMSGRFMQIGGAFHGDAAPSSISPFMASLLIIWLMLAMLVIYLSGRHD